MIEATYALLGHVIYTVPDKAVGDKIMRSVFSLLEQELR